MSAQASHARMKPHVMTKLTATHVNVYWVTRVSIVRRTQMSVTAIPVRMGQPAMTMSIVTHVHVLLDMQVSFYLCHCLWKIIIKHTEIVQFIFFELLNLCKVIYFLSSQAR